jgi:hypothetical protein
MIEPTLDYRPENASKSSARAFKPRRRRIVAILALTVASATGCNRIGSWFAAERCVLSERQIHARMAVRVSVEGSGPSGRACCLRCAITYARQTGRTVRVFSVSDHVTGRELPAKDATYVVGSAVAPCAARPAVASDARRELLVEIWDRCRTSTIAFADPAQAGQFQVANGGAIRTFGEVVGDTKVVPASRSTPLRGEQ